MKDTVTNDKERSAKKTRTVKIVIDGTPHVETVNQSPLATEAALVDKARAKVLQSHDGRFDRGEVLNS